MRRTLLILISLLAILVVAPAGFGCDEGRLHQALVVLARDRQHRRRRHHPLAERRHTQPPGRLDDRHLRLTRPPPGSDVLLQVRGRGHVQVSRRARPDQHRHDQGRRRTARSLARDLAAPDLLRPTHHPLRPDQQQEGRRERPAELSALRAGLRGRARDGDHRRRRHLQLQRDAEDPHHLSRDLEERVEPSRADCGRSVDLVRPDERLRHPCLRGAEHGAEAGAAAAVLELRSVGDDQARHARPELARPVPGSRSRSERTGCGSRCP